MNAMGHDDLTTLSPPKKKGALSHPSSRRKPGSMSGLFDKGTEQRDAAKWIPAFAGMTIKGSWRYCRPRRRPPTLTVPRPFDKSSGVGGNHQQRSCAPSPSTGRAIAFDDD